ncbi:unnamed protein product [Clavelina lepadiformis]|uniref:LanC-like protein 3 n=1 Tax=Clavelina lepadiformis TaxID=159417 RepID=A0ABP0F9B6_CLALP
MSRHFNNQFEDAGRCEVSQDFYKDRIMETVDKILSGLKATSKTCEKGVYTGTAGVAYCFYYLSQSGIFPEHHDKFLKLAECYISPALDKHHVRSRKDVGLLSGNGGVYMVAALIYNKLGDKQKYEKYIEAYQNLASCCEQVDFLDGGCDELFVGRAGYMFGILALEKCTGVNILPLSQVKIVWDKVIESGRVLSETNNVGDLPLVYKYHGKPYLGAAHGFSGILQALLSFPQLLKNNRESADLVKKSVDFILNNCLNSGNVATNLDAALHGNGKFLVHWCHGAAGVIYMFIRAYLAFGKDERYLNACRELAETVWQKGLLRKGPGICHGVAGSGYVFLLMYRLTGEQKYLYQAERFANFMFSDLFKAEARTPDRPFSLFEGLAGTICFLLDLLQTNKADYPLFSVFLE